MYWNRYRYEAKRRAVTEEWRKDLESRDWDGQFMRSKESAKYPEGEYNATKAIMTELGPAK